MRYGILLLLLSFNVQADYLLAVWEKGVSRSQPPLATKRFIAFSDCRRERDFILHLVYATEGNEVWVTCDYME